MSDKNCHVCKGKGTVNAFGPYPWGDRVAACPACGYPDRAPKRQKRKTAKKVKA